MSTTIPQGLNIETLPIACSLEAGEFAKQGEALCTDLFAYAEGRRELEDGMRYRFPGSDEFKEKLLAFAATERTCCTFFRFRSPSSLA